jgi:AraC-like DNA-binding protein
MREALSARGGNSIQPGGNARALNTGDGLVLAPHRLIRNSEFFNSALRTPHSADGGLLRASQLGPLKLQYFTVQPQFLNGLLTVSEWHLLEAVAEGAVLNFTSVEPIGQKFAHITNQTHSGGLTVRCALLQLWAGAVTGIFPASGAAAGANRLRDRFRQFIGQMLEAELSGKTLGELAEQLHCSERHFSRLFREEFGVPLRARQIELRLQRARQLLADSDAKIINVAYDSGYRHLGLFNAMFKRRFGVTPSEWRRKGGAQKPAVARAGDRKKIQPRMDANPAKRGGLKTWFPPRNNF